MVLSTHVEVYSLSQELLSSRLRGTPQQESQLELYAVSSTWWPLAAHSKPARRVTIFSGFLDQLLVVIVASRSTSSMPQRMALGPESCPTPSGLSRHRPPVEAAHHVLGTPATEVGIRTRPRTGTRLR